MKKIINNRPLFFIFMSFAIGIFFARSIFIPNIFIIIFLASALISLVYFNIKYKTLKKLICVVIAFCFGICSFFISYNGFNGNSYGTSTHEIVGRIFATRVYDSYELVVLDNVIVDGNKSGENFKVLVYDETNLTIGDVILFESNINSVKLFSLGLFNSYYYKNNIKQECSVNSTFVQSTNVTTIAEGVRERIRYLLFNNMPKEEASVCFASLFGDKSYIPNETRNSFSVSGMAHILAVSGLHIGFLVMAISFVISKIKTKRWLKVAILSSILLIYCYFCSFAPSVVRASLMFFILALAGVIGKKYDKLNAWSVAGLLILFISPLYVFDTGFQLSFICVLCILMFYQTFLSWLSKYHLPNSLASTLAVSIPVTIGILPIMCQHFSKISMLGIFANIIVVPIFEVFFIILFATTVLCLLLPFMSFVLNVPMFLIHIVILIAGIVSNMKFAIINLSPLSSMLVVSIYAVLFVLSHFVNMSYRIKTMVSVALLTFTCLLSGLMALPVKPSSNKISVLTSYNKNVYAIELGGKEFIIGVFNEYTNEASSQYLSTSKLYVADYYISLTNVVPTDTSSYKNIYTCSYAPNSTLLATGVEYDFDGVFCQAVSLYGNFVGILLSYQNMDVFVCNNKTLTEGLCMDFASNYEMVDILIGKEKYTKQLAKYLNCFELFDGNIIRKENNVLANCQGNWTFEIKNDNIVNVRSLD